MHMLYCLNINHVLPNHSQNITNHHHHSQLIEQSDEEKIIATYDLLCHNRSCSIHEVQFLNRDRVLAVELQDQIKYNHEQIKFNCNTYCDFISRLDIRFF